MASYVEGYDEERFETTVSRNFLCLICFNVLRDPVLCPKNQHCFCRACISKHLERNAQKCPTCADELTAETLTEAPRMVKDYLNELNIHCENANRGCQEIVQIQHLNSHEATCGFRPVLCTNQGCGVTVSWQDLIHHESKQCEFRKLKCQSCKEMTKTLADMEKRMVKIETSVLAMEKNVASMDVTTKIGDMEKNISMTIVNMEMKIENMEVSMNANFGVINNEVRELADTLLVKMNDLKVGTRDLNSTASGEKEKDKIIVAGGVAMDSVEIFNWPQKTWSPLQSLPEKRYGATSFVYNNHVTITGGWCPGSGYVNDMIKMNVMPNPDLSAHWHDCPVELPTRLLHHSSVLYNDQFITTGGYNANLNETSDCINDVQLVLPYAVKILSRMPEPRQCHCTEIFDNNLFVVGGTETGLCRENLRSVLLYDIMKNEYKQLKQLPYGVSTMATVKWGDNIVVIGGIDNNGNKLNRVLIYNVKTEQSHMLPSMKYKKQGCAAVVIGNNIVTLGGWGEKGRALKSVEAFNFDRYSWEELPEMSQARWLHTAVVV